MKIIFVNSSGERREVEASGGLSLVEVAMQNDIEEIEAECGGACSCATCHVLVAAEWLDKLPPIRMTEDEMLDILEDRRQPNSRLGCQIVMTPELDGLTVQTPAEQG